MNAFKNTLLYTATVSLLAIMVAAGAVHADELSMLAGGDDGHRHVALGYQTTPLLQGEFASHPLDLSLEYSLGLARASSGQPDRDLWHVGVTPFARWWLAPDTGVEFGIGANLFSGTRLGDKDISTAFQFGSSIGLVHRLKNSPWLLGLRLTHYSNADIKRPNPGQDYLQLQASYAFQ